MSRPVLWGPGGEIPPGYPTPSNYLTVLREKGGLTVDRDQKRGQLSREEGPGEVAVSGVDPDAPSQKRPEISGNNLNLMSMTAAGRKSVIKKDISHPFGRTYLSDKISRETNHPMKWRKSLVMLRIIRAAIREKYTAAYTTTRFLR